MLPAAPPPQLSGLSSRPGLLPPISGGTLAVAADGSIAVAADPDRDRVYLVDVPKHSVKTLQLPAASEPGRVVLDDLGQAHVVLRGTGKLAHIQLTAGELTQSETLCQYPRGLAYRAGDRSLLVACADGQLVTLSAQNQSVVAREQHLNDLRDVVISADDTLVLSRFRSAGLLSQGPSRESEVNPPDMPRPRSNVGAPDVPELDWVSTRATFAFRTVAAADGSVWMLHERAQLDIMQSDQFAVAGERCGPGVQPALTHWSVGQQPVEIDNLGLLGLAAPAVDLAISPDGNLIAIATPAAYAQGSSSVHLQMLSDLEQQAHIEPQIRDEEFPKDASTACKAPPFIQIAPDSQAVAVAFDRDNNLYVQNRFPARLDITHVMDTGGIGTRLVALGNIQIPLNVESDIRDAGHEWFHAALGRSLVSCAACHAEGMDDGHTWTSRSRGARRTPSLRGGFTQTAPFQWNGEYGSADALIMDIVVARLDAHNVPGSAVTAMKTWLDRLPALSLPGSPAAASGKALFESAELRCNDCHLGPQLTNNQTVDVGTGGPFQVPSLLGLALRGPYMHDGCAYDLKGLFMDPSCAGSGHAQLATLSAEQAADVQAYLESL
ncbi:MAG TPA: hypothetical protein VFN67_30120 [Polyangiales bacterium]|nr:hypothetical protein [Polyangiales bacterium]